MKFLIFVLLIYFSKIARLRLLIMYSRGWNSNKNQQTHLSMHIYDFPCILWLIKPTLKGPKQWSFPNILVITILAADVFIKMVQ